ncbi:MAG TPA: glycine betaine ABC transporter substrate-binding protein [Gammaproteobacteria bacterium]|nr:glycine betaine ABC transporter substrate-binding protein [Gammaproteobacteria bacterium]
MPHKPILTMAVALLATSAVGQQGPVVIGSKNFTEGYVLAEIMAQLVEARGIPVVRRFGFAGTLVAFEALRAGEIDVYAEYTGTIAQTILDSRALDADPALATALGPLGVEPLASLGFNNTYAIAVEPSLAESLDLERISDLRLHAQLRLGFSHEFRDRGDGWPGLKRAYELPQDSSGIEHGLAYQALLERKIDVTDAYSTDGDLERYGLRILTDDLGFFPEYMALPLVRSDLDPQVKTILGSLAGRLDEASMRALNAEVVVAGRTFADVAADFLAEQGLVTAAPRARGGLGASLVTNTLVHLKLAGTAVLAATFVGLGLALSVYRSPAASKLILYSTGLLQTVPSIALLALLIPIAGVGQVPAIIALFLYSLLPIARSTITALITIDPLLRRVAIALGLTQIQRLRTIYLPLALPHVLSGIRIAAVISIGTATLAAFVGAGGLGEPIVTGLALNDPELILQGAIPAALLAIMVELLFEALERWLVPAHLLTRHAVV